MMFPDYTPTEQCFLGISCDASNNSADEVNVIVMEKKSDGTVIVIDCDRTFTTGDVFEKRQRYEELVQKYSNKYNAKIVYNEKI